jgi:exonuclease III
MNQSLSVINWNVRGLNAPVRREAVRDMVQAARPLVVCLQETKLTIITPQMVAETFGSSFDAHAYLSAQGTRGGILLGWQTKYVDGSNLELKASSLTIQIKPKWLSSMFRLTTAYEPTKDEAKQGFLNELQSLKPAEDVPWIVIGDFNLIYQASNKNNLNLNHQLMGRFWRALNTCELFELELQNRKYTWINERQEPTLVQLDRAFYNKDWDLLHSGYSLHALSSSLSDHCPALLCPQLRLKQPAVFRFKNFWTRIPGFREVVHETWWQQVPSTKLFGSTRIELHMANEVIHRLDVAQDSKQLSMEEFQLRKELKTRVLG